MWKTQQGAASWDGEQSAQIGPLASAVLSCMMDQSKHSGPTNLAEILFFKSVYVVFEENYVVVENITAEIEFRRLWSKTKKSGYKNLHIIVKLCYLLRC